MDPFETIATTAEEQAYRYLLARIRTGVFKPGDRLVPEEIAADIGMSRMPVRDAFRRLATQELLTLRPNRGAVVRALSAGELAEVFEIRAVLEGLAAASALPKIGSDELERRLERMERAGDDASEWVAAHRDFHMFLCGFSGKPRLLAQISALHLTIEPHMRLWLQAAEKPRSSREDHGLILDAIKRKRPELLEAVVRDHVCSTIPALAALMAGAAPAEDAKPPSR